MGLSLRTAWYKSMPRSAMSQTAISCAKTAIIAMIHFELLMPNGALPGAIWTAVDVLRELNALARLRTPAASSPVVSWRVVTPQGRTHRFHALTCANTEERRCARHMVGVPHVLVLPPLELQSIPALNQLTANNEACVNRVREQLEKGASVGACGTGLWLLAATGRLVRAPLPWALRSGFEARFPSVPIETQHAMLVAQETVCAAAPELMHALVLQLASCAGQADLAHACAEKLLLNPERQNVSSSMSAAQVMGASRDTPLYRAQSWMQAHASHAFGLREVAAAASVSERSLHRLFAQHLNTTPARYLLSIRLVRAKMWLEGTWRSVEEIAHDSGYASVSAFCRMFVAETGTSPQRYREQYTFRGPRARWKTQGSIASP